MADDEFAPYTVTITSTIQVDNSRMVSQTLVWTQNIYTEGDVFADALILNDSDASEKGPGVFLSRAETSRFDGPDPQWVKTNFPTPYYNQNRIGDNDFEIRFGVATFAPEELVVGKMYQIIWHTPPGETALDNANIEFYRGESWFHYRFFVRFTRRCRSMDTRWLVDLPGTQTNHRPYIACLDYSNLFLPQIQGGTLGH